MLWVPRAQAGEGQRPNCWRNSPRRSRLRAGRLAIAATVGAVVFGARSRADTVTWIDPNSGLWREPYRWSTNPGFPGPADDVIIDVPGATILVTINQDVQTINSLLCNENLTVESGGLSVAANSVINGAFTLSGGTLSGSGNVTLNGPSTWVNFTTMEGTGKTIVSSTGSLEIVPGTFNKFLKRNLDNFGAITFTADAPFSSIALSDATVANKAGAVFNSNSDVDTFYFGVAGASSFVNEGTFNKQGTATATFGGTGSLPVPFINSGTVNVQAGTLILQTGATHTGHFSIATDGVLRFEGGHTFTSTADITGAGTLVFNNAGTNVSDGPVNVTGLALFAGATNTFNAPFSAGSTIIPNGGTFTFNGTTSLGSASLTNIFLGGTGDVTLSGNSNWSGFGTMSGSGRTIIAPASTFTFIGSAAPKNLQRNFINNGTVNWGGSGALASLNLTNAAFQNNPGATFNASGDQYSLFGVSGANAFNNAGIFNKSGTGSASFTGNGTSIVSFANSGTVNVSAGLLQFDGPFTNTGAVALSGGTMTLNVGLNNTTGVINITSGGVLNLGGTFAMAQLGNWSNVGGQVNLFGTLNNASATLALSDNTGSLRMQAGSQIIGGTLSTSGTSRVKILGGATLDGLTLSSPVSIFQAAELTILNGLTLGGTLTLDASGSSTATLQGTQTIGGAGTITTAGGTGSAATLNVSANSTLTFGPQILIHPGTRDLLIGGATNVTIVNQGSMLADAGRLLSLTGTSIQNLGTLQIDGGATLAINSPLANLSGGTLTGGVYRVSAGSTLQLQSGSNIGVNATTLVLDGVGASILSGSNDALANLSQNAATGDLSILNGRTLTTTGDFTNNGKLTVGANSVLTTPSLFTHNGTMTTAGTISTGKTIVDGFFTLAGGTHTVSTDFTVGNGKNSARYDLTAGTLNVGGFTTIGSGPVGAGVFNQSAGTFTVGRQLYVSTASTNTSTFNLSGGSLNAGELFIAFFGGAQGTFNQTGGAVTLAGNTAVSTTGALTLGFSSLPTTSGTYNLSNGTLSDQGVQIGFAGSDFFNQSGGTHTVNGAAGFSLGMFTGGTGTYSMSDGASLVVANGETIGSFGNGVFNQTGGTHTAGSTITLGAGIGSFGVYNLAGGTLSAPILDLQRGQFNPTGGTLNIGNFVQEGGEVTHTLQGQQVFTYIGGTFSARLINSGTVVLYTNFTAANGLDNRSDFAVGTNRAVTLSGAGLANSSTISVGGSLTASVTLNNGLYTQTAGASSLGNVSGTGSVNVSGGKLNATSIRQNTLAVSNNGLVTLATAGGPSILNNLTISGPSAAVDLKNNALLIDYTGTSVADLTRALLASGYGTSGAHWTAPGIRSSTAAADPTLGLAIAEAADLLHISGTQTATFAGETVDASTVLVRLAKLGDTNLDGKVTFGDFQRLELGYGQPNATWLTGDFNYDGVVNDLDFAALYANYGQSLAGPAAPVSAAELQALSLFANTVPEPAASLWLGGASVLFRRGRRSLRAGAAPTS